jgi:hypothetical protein
MKKILLVSLFVLVILTLAMPVAADDSTPSGSEPSWWFEDTYTVEVMAYARDSTGGRVQYLGATLEVVSPAKHRGRTFTGVKVDEKWDAVRGEHWITYRFNGVPEKTNVLVTVRGKTWDCGWGCERLLTKSRMYTIPERKKLGANIVRFVGREEGIWMN